MRQKMWIVFAICSFVSMIVTEIIRSIVHRRREKRYGLGGTQDIAMWGTLVTIVLQISAIACALIWWEKK